MKYISTRGKSDPCSISQALLQGLAPDGGLYVPKTWPEFKVDAKRENLDFPTFAARVLAPFFVNDPLASHLPDICQRAFNFPIPLKELKDSTSVLELFYGPTCAFKDIGARFLALCLEAIPARKKDLMVLVATSGDTGGAVAAAFHDCTHIPVTILFPQGKISERQEKQLTVWGEQIQAFAVDGNFDDCQRLVKEAFLSPEWQNRFQLISANSINIARLLPQMAYFAYTSCKYFFHHHAPPGFIIPSGNIGNSVGALWAQKIGFPIRKIIFAHNANSTVPDYLKTGEWMPQPSVTTLANAMDVGSPSNFERVLSLYPKIGDLKKIISATSVSDENIRSTIAMGIKNWGQIWCPHTATAVYLREQEKDGNWIIVATAHPAKFESIVEPLIGKKVEIPAQLNALLNKDSKFKEIPAKLNALKENLIS